MAEQSPSPPPSAIAIRNQEGQVIVRVGLLLSLYFENGGDRAVVQRVAQCVTHFRAVAGSHLRWVLLPDAERFQRISVETVEAFETWMRSGIPDYSWGTAWLGGRNPHEASEYRLSTVGMVGALPKLSYLQLVLPLNPSEPQYDKFAALALRFCELLQPYHGYAGLGFITSVDGFVEDEAQPLVYSMSQRFVGIEVDKPVNHVLELAEGIKGVNWLTVLGPRWVKAMGGVDVLRSQLREEYVFHAFGAGLMIQAGPCPQAGDRNQRVWPALYPELARLLKPIRNLEFGCFANNGSNRFTNETTTEWVTRFDREPF